MISDFLLAALAALLLASFWILKKMVGTEIPPSWGIIFIYMGGLIFVTLAFLAIRPEFKPDILPKRGIILALLAGIIIAAFDVLTLAIFKRGASTAVTAPLINGGALVAAVVAGIFLLKESISFINFLGILTVIIGIILLKI